MCRGKFWRLFPIFALGLPPLALSAANNLIFLLQNSSTTASIYDADMMTLLAPAVAVGAGAVKAFGAPDPNNPGQFLKLYVVTSSSVVVLNPSAPFSVRATAPLPGVPASSPNSAVLTPDGRWLLVAAGNQVSYMSTADATDSIANIAGAFTAPFGIAVLPNSTRAYVASFGSPVVQIIDLTQSPPQLLSTTVNVGSAATAIGAAPNGSRIYVATAGSVYDIDRVSNAATTGISNPAGASSITFDPDPPVPAAVLNGGVNAPILNLSTRTVGASPLTLNGVATINKVVVPGANRAFLLAGGRLYQGFLSAGGMAAEVNNPLTGTSFGGNAADMDVSPDGSRLFVVFSDARLVKLDTAGSTPPVQVSTLPSPTGVSAVYLPVIQPPAILEIYGGNNQSGPANTTFPATLAVRARTAGGAPVFGQTVTFTSSTPGVLTTPSPVTNLLGVAESLVSVPVTTPVNVTASLTGATSAAPVTFTLNGTTTTGNQGPLVKVSGDYQYVLQNTAFPAPLMVQDGPNVTLTVTAGSTVTCPGSVTTDANGMAAIFCTAGAVTASGQATISVTDPSGNTLADPFHAQVVLTAAELPTVLTLEALTPLTGTVRQTLSNAIQVVATRADGRPVSNVGVYFTSAQDVTFNPQTVVTASGTATTSVTFGCFLGSGSIRATMFAPNLPSANESFFTTPGPPSQIIKKQGDNQKGNAGQVLSQALVVQLTDACGNAATGQTVSWSVNPTGAAALVNRINTTDFQGNASTLVQLGTVSGPLTVTATAGSLTATFNLTVNVNPTQLLVSSGNNQTVVLGQAAPQPLVVEVKDNNGVAVPGVSVTFAVTGGSATLGSPAATTDAAGRASTTVQAGSTLGAITVTASAIGKTVSFTLNTVGRVPVVTPLGFVNGASFRAGWVPGSAGSIFGSGLMEGINGVVGAGQAPFPTTLQGVRVTVAGIDAPILSLVNIAGQEQINVQVPATIQPGTVTVVITNNGSSATVPGVQIFAVQPGIFEFNSSGTMLAAALHADFSVVTQTNPARRGEIILLFVTGLGATNPPVQTNVAGPVSPPAATIVQPVVGINGKGAQVLGSWYAPLLYTAYQINFVIPADAAPGLASLSVVAGSAASQDSRIPIQ